jgi:hypothetical protein
MEVEIPKVDASTGEVSYDENGDVVTESVIKEYKIQSIVKQEGEMYAKVNEVVGLKDQLYYEGVALEYTQSGFLYENGELTSYRVQLDENGRIETNDSGTPVILDENGQQIEDSEYLSKFLVGGTDFIYGDEEILPLASITRLS